MTTPLRDFLEIPYDELEDRNLAAKKQRLDRVPADKIQDCFTDLEGRFHMLDYDKKFLLASVDNLTFDGSSIRGFSQQRESDLRLRVDWPAFYWLPSDVFGPGKVLAMAEVLERDGAPYAADSRGLLKQYTDKLFAKDGTTCFAANEIEGFLFKGRDAERRYHEAGKFEFISTGGYYHSLPGDALRLFIDTAAEVQRAMGFANEKDHPEVAPSQFEMNYSYAEAVIAADQVQLYKLLSRQVAARMDMTACFLPKPVTGVNGNGMHTNVSVGRKGKNLFWEEKGQDQLAQAGWGFIKRILSNGAEICLLLNSSVNSYRRLDPHFEAPNQIKASPIDRGSMIRIPLGNERSKRVEVRSIAPDANPYLAIYTIFKTGLEGPTDASKGDGAKYLSDNIYDAIRLHQGSRFLKEALGEDVHGKFAELKQMQADRCPKALGAEVKAAEIQFHHEVTNQYLWSKF